MKRALVCAPRMPEFDRERGSQLIFDLIGFLQEAGWAVTFIAQRHHGGERYARRLQQRGVESYAGFDDRAEQRIAMARFEVALFAFWHMAEKWMPLVRRLSPETRILVHTIDLHFVRHARQLFQPSGDEKDDHSRQKFPDEMARELSTYASADGVLTVSQKEADLVNDLLGDPALAYVAPDSEELARSKIPFNRRQGLLFLGNFRHPPNVQALEYLCREVVPRLDPRVLERHPVYVVGNALEGRLLSCANGRREVRMVGWVPSVLQYLERSRVSVVPLLHGAGTKGKLVQALMVGTPSVTTTVGIEGLDLKDGRHVLVADDPNTFADAVGRVVRNARLWQDLASQGRRQIMRSHSRAAARKKLMVAVAAVLARQPKQAAAGAGVPSDRPLTPSEYRDLTGRLREAVQREVPPGATVLVVSKGDEQLVRLDGRKAWHFPQDATGTYCGYHPADSAAAIAHLEALRLRGGQYLLLPHTSLWWLDHYHEFGQHLEKRYRIVFQEEGLGILYGLASLEGNGR
jgi:glycosyltransferase involved in cell wall biosynthesis